MRVDYSIRVRPHSMLTYGLGLWWGFELGVRVRVHVMYYYVTDTYTAIVPGRTTLASFPRLPLSAVIPYLALAIVGGPWS